MALPIPCYWGSQLFQNGDFCFQLGHCLCGCCLVHHLLFIGFVLLGIEFFIQILKIFGHMNFLFDAVLDHGFGNAVLIQSYAPGQEFCFRLVAYVFSQFK